jgi:hypothetical protein
MGFWTMYGAVVCGIVISVVLPIIRALLPKPPLALRGEDRWKRIRPYVATGCFAAIVALLIIAAVGDSLDTPAKALIAGYAWDSTLQKLSTGNASVA